MPSTALSEAPIAAGDATPACGTSLIDQELIARVIRRDEAALGVIYDRYHRLLYSVALRITGDRDVADEVLQDVFHAVWRSAGAFRPAGNLTSWLLGITRHRAIDATRARNYRARVREYLLDDMQMATLRAPADDLGDQQVMRLMVRSALAELSPAHRQALDLAYFGGLTHAEIAAKLGVPLGTVKSRLRHGLMHLRQRLLLADWGDHAA
jgi:RNA polymerase sigma-70 factor, ECF subfamily